MARWFLSQQEIAARSLLQAEQLGRILHRSQQDFQDFCTYYFNKKTILNATLFMSILGADLAEAEHACPQDHRIEDMFRTAAQIALLTAKLLTSSFPLSPTHRQPEWSWSFVQETSLLWHWLPEGIFNRLYIYIHTHTYILYIYASIYLIIVYYIPDIHAFALRTLPSFWSHSVQRCWNGRFLHLCMPKPLRLLVSKGQGIRGGESTHFVFSTSILLNSQISRGLASLLSR